MASNADFSASPHRHAESFRVRSNIGQGEVQKSLNEAAVEIGKAQEGLNLLLVAWSWPFRYSGDFYRVHLRLSMGDDKSEVFNFGLCELAFVMSEIEFVLSEPFQY
jgi:hypothetical protein